MQIKGYHAVGTPLYVFGRQKRGRTVAVVTGFDVSRTIADLAGSGGVKCGHIA